jgi:uncharacterized protein with HEPN domain
MRDDKAYLLDIVIAARKIQKFVSDLSEDEFRKSELHQSAVIRELQVIGEACRSISAETKLAHPEVEWEQIGGMRNYIVHEYFRVKLHIVWDTVQNEIVRLINQLQPLIPPESQ